MKTKKKRKPKRNVVSRIATSPTQVLQPPPALLRPPMHDDDAKRRRQEKASKNDRQNSFAQRPEKV
jgi:hypothetical protein